VVDNGINMDIPSGTTSLRTGKIAIEIVDLPTKNGDFPFRYVSLPEGK